MSASGKLTERLQILAGAVLMDPVVTGFAVDAGAARQAAGLGTLSSTPRSMHNYRTKDIFGGPTTLAYVSSDGRRAISSAPYHSLHVAS